MNPISDYTLGKARHQELEAEVYRTTNQYQERLGQMNISVLDGLSTLNLSSVLPVVGVTAVVGSQLLGM